MANGTQSRKLHLYCKHSNHCGHSVDNCWAKHGLSIWWKFKRSHDSRNRMGFNDEIAAPSLYSVDIPGLTSAQRQRLYDLSVSWLLDSGASHHVTGNRDLLVYTQDITHCPIGLLMVHKLFLVY